MLRNRNRKNRHFLQNRNRNLITDRYKMESQKFSQAQYKIVYLISFILTFFSFKFYKKFDETWSIFSLKSLRYFVKKGNIFTKILLKTVHFVVQIRSQNRNS